MFYSVLIKKAQRQIGGIQIKRKITNENAGLWVGIRLAKMLSVAGWVVVLSGELMVLESCEDRFPAKITAERLKDAAHAPV